MVDMLKITSPITPKNKVENISKQLPKDVAFDITNPNPTEKKVDANKSTQEDGTKEFLLKNLNKEIYEPLLNSTKAESDSLRKLVLMVKLFENSPSVISREFLDQFFIKPEQLLSELLTKDKNETIFKGDLFDSLRVLSKLSDQPRLKDAIVSILKAFDCFVKQEQSLQAILIQSKDLTGSLLKTERGALNEAIQKLSQNIETNKENPALIRSFIKSEFVPALIGFVKSNRGDQKIYNKVMSVIHNVMRFDGGDPVFLEEAIVKFGEELSRLTPLSKEDMVGMKKLAFEHADKIIEAFAKNNPEKSLLTEAKPGKAESEMASLLIKALDGTTPGKISSVAQNLMAQLLQNESPILPFMHFTIPLRFLDENTYGEFFIDKNCKERKGDAKEAKNIFFTIQSDKYGNFEVDLLEKDKTIELDIRCPDLLIDPVKEFKTRIKDLIEDQGYRLFNYKVGVYKDNTTILGKFPSLALRKAGIDVKV